MAIVLREAPHAHDAVQTARRLVAVALSELAVAQGQVTVAFDALLENQDVTWAVHRLEGVIALFRLGGEHVVTVLVPVTGFFPQALVDDLRAFDLLITVVSVDLAHVLLNGLPDGPAFGVPEHQTRGMLIDVKQVEFSAQFAMVALFRFFQACQVLLQIVLASPGRAINTLQHLVLAVTTPVSARDLHQFEVLELAGAGHVGATAQVFEVAFTVETHVLVCRDAGDDFGFVVFAQALEVGDSLVSGQNAADHRFVFAGQLGHALFDGDQVFGGERTAIREVVIKAVFDHRTDRDLRLGKQILDRIGKQVGGGVANQLQAFRIFGRHDGQLGIRCHAEAGVDQLAIHLAAQGRLGQASADG